jgi:chromosome segregation ATPase
MSDDLTKKLPKGDSENIALILTLVQSIESRIDRLESRLDDFERWLDSLEKKVDERLYDTRPIWERVVADVAQLQDGQNQIKKSVGHVERKLSVITDTLVDIRADYKDIDKRVYAVEHQQKPTNSQT